MLPISKPELENSRRWVLLRKWDFGTQGRGCISWPWVGQPRTRAGTGAQKNPAGREGLPAGLREEVWYVWQENLWRLQKFGTFRPPRYRIHLKSGSFGEAGMFRVVLYRT